MNQLKPTPSQYEAMGMKSPEAIKAQEAADRATAAALQTIIASLRDAMGAPDKPKALQAVAKSLTGVNQSRRAEDVLRAASRLSKDPLDFYAVAAIHRTVDDLTSSARMLGYTTSMTADTPGAVVPPEPKRPDDYAKSMARFAEQYEAHQRRQESAMHPIDALASRNGLR